MSINDFLNKIKPFYNLFILLLSLIILSGFAYIYINQRPKGPIKILISDTSDGSLSEKVVASKTGTRYYFPWCSGASRIKTENRLEFATVALARANGYTPAKNCKGLK